MERLIPAIRSKLTSDATLMGIVSDVRYWKAPREPKQLIKPVAVFEIFSFTDKPGQHGLTSIPLIEFNIYSYDQDGSQIIDATTAANRISDLLLSDRLSITGGGATRLSLNTGWNVIPQTDVNTIRLMARFITSYWSPTRLEAFSS
jgi:hypothetical protein